MQVVETCDTRLQLIVVDTSHRAWLLTVWTTRVRDSTTMYRYSRSIDTARFALLATYTSSLLIPHTPKSLARA